MSKKILSNIEPFNDIYYESCFYNSLISVIKHYKRSLHDILFNNIIVYSWDKSKSVNLTTEYIYIKPLQELLKEMGLRTETKKESKDIITDIINSINNDRPVIIWVDCFYESIRVDTYRKKHLPHTLLVYGYDDVNKFLNIIEHKQAETLTYQESAISYNDAVQSYLGYFLNFNTDIDYASYFEFYTDDNWDKIYNEKNIFENSICIYYNNLLKYESTIYKGVEELNCFIDLFSEIALNETMLSKNAEGLVNSFNKIILDKQVEKYKLCYIEKINQDLICILDQIINLWINIRKYIAKFLYSSIYKEETIRKTISNINQIVSLEKQYNECLLEELKNII